MDSSLLWGRGLAKLFPPICIMRRMVAYSHFGWITLTAETLCKLITTRLMSSVLIFSYVLA